MKAANPYVGPRAFQTGEKLFGRSRETADLADVLIAERIVLMSSPSGAGKSSLINAALVPLMREQGFEVFPPMRVSRSLPPEVVLPADANRFVVSLLLSLEEARPVGDRVPLEELMTLTLPHYLAYRERVDSQSDSDLFIFDQFEEILTIDAGRNAARTEFFEQVGLALRDKARWGLFAMREEFVAALQPYVRSVPTRLTTHFRLDRLTREAAIEAVTEPSREAGVLCEAEAALELVGFMSVLNVQQPDGTMKEEFGDYVEPVHLQVTCRRLWDELPADQTTITAEYVQSLGSLDRALVDYYEDLVTAAARVPGVRERSVREWIEKNLITDSGFRGEVMQRARVTAGLDNAAITVLVEGYLVRPEQRRGAIWYELAHDRLIDPIRKSNAAWLEAHLSVVQRQAATWQEQSRPAGLLMAGESLVAAEKWAADNAAHVLEVERDFLDACRAARLHLRRNKQKNMLLFGLMVAGISVLLVDRAREKALDRDLAAAGVEADQAHENLDQVLKATLERWGWDKQLAAAAADVQIQEAMLADTAFKGTMNEVWGGGHLKVTGHIGRPSKMTLLFDAVKEANVGLEFAFGGDETTTHAAVKYAPQVDPLLAKVLAYALIRTGIAVTAISQKADADGIEFGPDPVGVGNHPRGLSVAEVTGLNLPFELVPFPAAQEAISRSQELKEKLGTVTGRSISWGDETLFVQEFEHGALFSLPWSTEDEIHVLTVQGQSQQWSLFPWDDRIVAPPQTAGGLPSTSVFFKAWMALKSTLGNPVGDGLDADSTVQKFTNGTVFAVARPKKWPLPKKLPFFGDGPTVLVLLNPAPGKPGIWMVPGR